jgi:carbamoyltransferase
VIVNTSFNIRGEPIVGSLEDAYQCFLSTDMDCLVLENYVLLKDNLPPSLLDWSRRNRAKYIAAFSPD